MDLRKTWLICILTCNNFAVVGEIPRVMISSEKNVCGIKINDEFVEM